MEALPSWLPGIRSAPLFQWIPSLCISHTSKATYIVTISCNSGSWYSCRCVELQPLCAAAHRALGLVAEAREDAAEAAWELELALELTVSDDPHQGASSMSALLLVSVHPLHYTLQATLLTH